MTALTANVPDNGAVICRTVSTRALCKSTRLAIPPRNHAAATLSSSYSSCNDNKRSTGAGVKRLPQQPVGSTITSCSPVEPSVSADPHTEDSTLPPPCPPPESSNGSEPSVSPVAEVYPLDKTRELVETAMLAAVSGLAFLLATVVKLEGYLGYLLPLPIVLAAMRNGPRAARKTMTATCCLLLVLLGPVRSITYLFNHGMFSLTLGTLWRWRVPWLVSIPLAAVVRVLGTLAYLTLSSWTLNENLFALLVNNVFGLLDEMGAVLRLSGSPSQMMVVATIGSLLAVNSLFYVLLMHVFYEIILKNMGYSTGRMPALIAKIIYRRQPGML